MKTLSTLALDAYHLKAVLDSAQWIYTDEPSTGDLRIREITDSLISVSIRLADQLMTDLDELAG